MGQEGGGDDGTDTFDLLEAFGFGEESGIGLDAFGDPGVELLDLASELADQGFGLSPQRLEQEMFEAILFGRAGGDELRTTAGKGPEFLLGLGGWHIGWRSEFGSVIGQFESIDGIGLGAAAFGPSKVASLPRVDDTDRPPRVVQGQGQGAFVATGRLEDDMALGRKDRQQLAMAGGGVGKLALEAWGRQNQAGLGDIDAKVDFGGRHG